VIVEISAPLKNHSLFEENLPFHRLDKDYMGFGYSVEWVVLLDSWLLKSFDCRLWYFYLVAVETNSNAKVYHFT
jgi:hypothetical protein